MFNKKQNKAETFTPADLERFNDKYNNIYTRTGARSSALEISKTQKWKRRGLFTLIVCLATLLILYIISMILTQWGDLVVSVDSGASAQGLQISDTADFDDITTVLNADNVTDVTNITYSWLPADLEATDGSHNGSNYLAYTLYVKNAGKENIDYKGQLNINGVAKNMDEAVRVMVYKNGEPFIYAKNQYGTDQPEPDTTAFVSDTTVMETQTKEMQPNDVDKYTIVAWVEGNDPECVDEIMGGYMRMTLLFSLADKEL